MTTEDSQRGAFRTDAAVPEGATADNEVLLDAHRDGHPMVPYKALWAVLLLGWVVSYSDRTLTGPVVAWMIENKTGFIGDATNPATIGGLIGSMFFLGYMLTQYPGGRLGDRFGHREMIIVSLLAAAVLTIVSGLVSGLVAFVAARVLTGLGEYRLAHHWLPCQFLAHDARPFGDETLSGGTVAGRARTRWRRPDRRACPR